MKKYKFWIETGVVGADFYEINEVEDNVTEEKRLLQECER